MFVSYVLEVNIWRDVYNKLFVSSVIVEFMDGIFIGLLKVF